MRVISVAEFKFHLQRNFLQRRRGFLYGSVLLTLILCGFYVNQYPTADFTYYVTDYNEYIVAFDGSSSSDPDGYITQWCWDFGDGSSVYCSSSQGATHDYVYDGYFDVTLEVTDNGGLSDMVKKQIYIPGDHP